ncbi:hypothetical protein [Pelagibius marinus]|nr:hypothetical protein [Pelagibius marinus]
MNAITIFVSVVPVAIAFCVAVWITVKFLWNLRRGDEPSGRKLWR